MWSFPDELRWLDGAAARANGATDETRVHVRANDGPVERPCVGAQERQQPLELLVRGGIPRPTHERYVLTPQALVPDAGQLVVEVLEQEGDPLPPCHRVRFYGRGV
jgi:hypothetical protein